MSTYSKLDKIMKEFHNKYNYILDEFGSHELRFLFGTTPSGVYSACFTFSFPRSGANKKYAEDFYKMIDDFKNCFNYEECKQNGPHWTSIRDESCYNFINPYKKSEHVLCSFDMNNWINKESMKKLLKCSDTKSDIHIRYISNTKHSDILKNIDLVNIIKNNVKDKYNVDDYLDDVDEQELINSVSKYLNRNCESNIETIEIEKTVSVEYFLENY